jgi:hypothetical protein
LSRYVEASAITYQQWQFDPAIVSMKLSTQVTMIPNPTITEALQNWLKIQILHLSVETLKSNAVTCTACGEVQRQQSTDRFRRCPIE